MCGKRKRGNFTEDEMLLLTNMSDAVNNVINALRETGVAHVDPDSILQSWRCKASPLKPSLLPTPTC
jgi:ribonucleotide monophosphatase NagD (HAD superfamily)